MLLGRAGHASWTIWVAGKSVWIVTWASAISPSILPADPASILQRVRVLQNPALGCCWRGFLPRAVIPWGTDWWCGNATFDWPNPPSRPWGASWPAGKFSRVGRSLSEQLPRNYPSLCTPVCGYPQEWQALPGKGLVPPSPLLSFLFPIVNLMGKKKKKKKRFIVLYQRRKGEPSFSLCEINVLQEREGSLFL